MAHIELTSGEIYALDLDYDLIFHLAIPESISFLEMEHFDTELIQDDLARRVFNWQISHIREHGSPATGTVLEDQFEELSLAAPETAIGDLVGRMRARYVRNQGREALKRLAQKTVDDPLDMASNMANEARRLVDITVKRGEVFGTGDWQRLESAYHEQVLRGPGPSLGYEELDRHFYGQTGLTFVLAAPKTYKSWFVIQTLLANTRSGRYSVLYPLELPALDTEWRMALMAAGIPPWRYLRRSLSRDDLTRLEDAFEELNSLGTHRVEKPPSGERNAEQLVRKAQDAGADLVIIDQLQYLETDSGMSLGEGKTQDYWGVINKLRDLSDEIPIMIVHQFNRNVIFADKMPEVQLAKGSAAIEEAATLALGLWASKDMRASRMVELGTLASRHFEYKSWSIGISFNSDCQLSMLGEVTE